MSSYQSWFHRDDRLPLLNRDWHGPGRLVAQGSVIALEVPAGKREASPEAPDRRLRGAIRRTRVRVNFGLTAEIASLPNCRWQRLGWIAVLGSLRHLGLESGERGFVSTLVRQG